jgi:hypothetical protein
MSLSPMYESLPFDVPRTCESGFAECSNESEIRSVFFWYISEKLLKPLSLSPIGAKQAFDSTPEDKLFGLPHSSGSASRNEIPEQPMIPDDRHHSIGVGKGCWRNVSQAKTLGRPLPKGR